MSRFSALTENEGAGVPVSVASAFSKLERWRRRMSICVSVVSMSACCCATSSAERAFLQVDRVGEDVELDVGLPQVEVGGGEVGDEQEARRLEVRRRLLGGSPRGGDEARHAATEVDLVARLQADEEVGLHRGEVRRRVVVERPVLRDARARVARGERHLRPLLAGDGREILRVDLL